MEPRDPEPDDAERVRELVESALTASYALSPRQIEALLEDNFGRERLEDAFEDSNSVTLVVESTVGGAEATVGGIVEANHDEDEGSGEVRWLFVDPEHRGDRIGTHLFETAAETLREQGADRITASTFEANREGEQFFERFGFEQVDDRQVEVAGESLVEYVYGEPSIEAEPKPSKESEAGAESNADLPNTETEDGITTATTDEGQQVYIDFSEDDSGTERPFFVAYADQEHTDQFGYYCANCGSLDTVMDNMGRIECSDCSNTHAERSDEAYDDSYL